MNISFVFPAQLGNARQFLVEQALTNAATQQQHQIVATEQADIVLLFEPSVPANLIGRKGAIVDLEQALNQPETTLQQAIADAAPLHVEDTPLENHGKTKNIVAVTACPTGVAQTFMSAEAISNYAKTQGWNIKIETRGQIGANNLITAEEVQAADLVFIATDIDVDLSKFEGKPMYRTSTKLAMKNTAQEFEKAFNEATIYTSKKVKNTETTPQACNKSDNCSPCQFARFLPLLVGAGALIAIAYVLFD
ncbi:MAG: fructose PTS transporter subunit IIB [Pasteurellaceae bacterium]|nr:fructose PTS transporter subunit IIB [Pasteurellaceae bacterium]